MKIFKKINPANKIYFSFKELIVQVRNQLPIMGKWNGRAMDLHSFEGSVGHTL